MAGMTPSKRLCRHGQTGFAADSSGTLFLSLAAAITGSDTQLEYSLGFVRRSRLVNQLELSSKAMGAGVLQQAAHRVCVQVSDELPDLPDLAGHSGLQGLKRVCVGPSRLKEK